MSEQTVEQVAYPGPTWDLISALTDAWEQGDFWQSPEEFRASLVDLAQVYFKLGAREVEDYYTDMLAVPVGPSPVVSRFPTWPKQEEQTHDR